MTKTAKLAAIATLAVIALTGCGSDDGDDTPATPPAATIEHAGDLHVRIVNVEGRKIPCVVYDGYKAGGISCDWPVKP